ncbi:16298_t:CDS:1, partial [Gigaspora rosea]
FSGNDCAPSVSKEKKQTTKSTKPKKKTQVIEEEASSKTAKKSIFDVDVDGDNSEEFSANEYAP